jgi:hypothetical protein
MGIFIVVHSKSQLFEIIAALHPASSLASCLYGRQKQTYQDANNGDHDEQFHQGETATIQRLTHNQTLSRNRKEHYEKQSKQYVERSDGND